MAEPSAAEKAAMKKKLRQVETLVLAPEVDQLAREYYTQEEYDAKFKKKKKIKNRTIRGKDKKKKKGLTANDLMDDLAEPLKDDPVPMDIEDSRGDDSDADVPARGLNDEDLSLIVLEPDEAQVELEATLNRARKLKKAKLRANGADEETSVEKLAREITENRKQNGEDEDNSVGFEGTTEVLTFNETAEFARSLGEIPGGSTEDDMFGGPGPSRARSPSPEGDPFEKVGDEDDMEISEGEGE